MRASQVHNSVVFCLDASCYAKVMDFFGQADYDVGGNLLRLYSKFAQARASRFMVGTKYRQVRELFLKLDFIKEKGIYTDMIYIYK